MLATFARPQARLRRRNSHLLLSVTGRPAEAQTEVRLLAHSKRTHKPIPARTLRSAAASITLPGAIVALMLRYIDPHDTAHVGPWLTLRAPRPSHAH
jgi:hypothetical protein